MSYNLRKTALTMFIVALIAMFSYSYSFCESVANVQDTLKTSQIKDDGNQAGAGQTADNSGVVMADVLNVRSGPWGNILGTIKEGAKIEITGRDGVWFKIKYNGGEAYVHSGYIATEKAPATAYDAYVNTPGSCLNVRTGAWGEIIGQLGHGSAVEILGKQGDWYQIKYNNREAYVHSDYITKTKPECATPSPAPASGTGGFGGRPVAGGPITSEYGPRELYGNFHHGIDIGVGTGTPAVALGGGTVVGAGWDYGGGNTLTIKYDNGYTSVYCHMQKFDVQVGQRVEQGQQVATTNNTGAYTTGPHLHCGLKGPDGQYMNPRDVPGLSF